MKSKINIKRVSPAVVSVSAALLLALPLIAGAQPESFPTGGNVVPTFYGLNINNGTAVGLNVNQDGQLSNPSDSINGGIVMVEDSNGLRIKQSTIMLPAIMIPRTLTFSPYGEIMAAGGGSIFSPAITPVTVRDTHGFRVANSAGVHQFSVDGATGTLSNPGPNNDGNVYVEDGFEVNSNADITPPADWIAAGGANPMTNFTEMLAKDGVFELMRKSFQFSPTRYLVSDEISMTADGSLWRFSNQRIVPVYEGGDPPAISLLKHGVGKDDPIKLAATGGTALGYIEYQFGPEIFVPVFQTNRSENATITDDNSKLIIKKPSNIFGVNIPDSANHMAIDNAGVATCINPITGTANHPCPVTINSSSALGGLLTGTIYAAGQFIGTPLLRAGGMTIYTQDGGLTVDATGTGGLTVTSATGGLTINSDSSGGIDLNSATGGISNKRSGYSPVRVNDTDGLYVTGPITSMGKIKSYGGIGTFTKRSVTVDIAAGTHNTAYPTCNAGETLISCGYKTSNYSVVPAVNMMNTAENKCEVAALNSTGIPETLTGEAMCFNPGV